MDMLVMDLFLTHARHPNSPSSTKQNNSCINVGTIGWPDDLCLLTDWWPDKWRKSYLSKHEADKRRTDFEQLNG